MSTALRIALIDLGMLVWACGAVYFWLQDLEENGYHWFRTPMAFAWLTMTFWALLFKGAGDLNERLKEEEA